MNTENPPAVRVDFGTSSDPNHFWASVRRRPLCQSTPWLTAGFIVYHQRYGQYASRTPQLARLIGRVGRRDRAPEELRRQRQGQLGGQQAHHDLRPARAVRPGEPGHPQPQAHRKEHLVANGVDIRRRPWYVHPTRQCPGGILMCAALAVILGNFSFKRFSTIKAGTTATIDYNEDRVIFYDANKVLLGVVSHLLLSSFDSH